MTATERRDQQREQYLEMMSGCASRQVLEILGDKWVTLILHALAEGPQRRGALSREVVGASQKMLTQTLRSLERDGLVARTIIPDVPVHVEYRLTPLGRSLRELVCTIADWSQANIGTIQQARAKQDAETRGDLVSAA
jgi:DNA-binding HxlR family transcriptional regulator